MDFMVHKVAMWSRTPDIVDGLPRRIVMDNGPEFAGGAPTPG